MFPQDQYTPHGYLANPQHTWKAGPSGVFRSRPAVGIGWYYPSFPHAYNYVLYYRAHLQLVFKTSAGEWLLDQVDFSRAAIELISDYHSKNWLSFVFETPARLHYRIIFFVAQSAAPDQDALGCLVQIRNRAEQPAHGSLLAVIDYEKDLGQGLDWTSGLYTRRDDMGLNIAGFQEGPAFHLRALHRPLVAAYQAADMVGLRARLDDDSQYEAAPLAEGKVSQVAGLEYAYQCEPGAEQTFMLVLARDVSEFRATRRAKDLLDNEAVALYAALAGGQAEDSRFWSHSPRLQGDWPEHVRRGLVYDFETLRMIVRQPVGIYKHRWDAMQIQVPRTVLAEVALDMLILSYADQETAKEILLGVFADSPEPNVPCSREDGSYNMVAQDGSACGTAPEWCFPFHCIELVYRRSGDRAWLSELYPYLEAYIDWWQLHRSDEQGRPYYKCSWEAGQDNSARFMLPPDPTGGAANGEHLWPVDLQAALAQACWLLAAWAGELDLASDKQAKWNSLGSRHAALTQKMWQSEDNWFHDFDRRTGAFTGVLDTMQLAPLLCRAANPAQVEALQRHLENPPKHGQVFHPLMWPSIAFCLVEACSQSGRADLAAHHGWQALDAAYRWMDARPASVEAADGGLPGVAREYWPQVTGPQATPPHGGGGAEVYGWGCLGVYMLLRYVVGIQEEPAVTDSGGPGKLLLTPNLPDALLQPDRLYQVTGFTFGQHRLDVSYRVLDNGHLETTILNQQAEVSKPAWQGIIKNGTSVSITL